MKLSTRLLLLLGFSLLPALSFASSNGDGHSGGTTPLFFVIIALIIGAATRHLLRKSPVPFTVLLFLFGLGLGAFARFSHGALDIGGQSIDVTPFQSAIAWAAHIDPHLLLYIFLPILIFEAAFAMDTHTFRKSVSNALILAIPGIIIALLLTAGIAIGMQELGLGLNGWNWPIAFMFGAVVSATDPVAVVSILKELGASKKLGTLIEGESLLNDGTAIVIFMVFFGQVAGVEADLHPLLQFLKVAGGGALLGWVSAQLVVYWLKRVYNDALVEISIIVAASYLTFYTAEHFLTVSGVLALVVFGVIMSGRGKTQISPEVGHFLHEFWELAAFIANSLIFLIVGVVISSRVTFDGADLLNLLLLYIGIHVVRAFVLLTFFPIMTRLGYGIGKKQALVLWWGALRGAIGLALTLIVAEEAAIPEPIREEFLFLTSGVIMLTLVVNATSMKAVVSMLGLTSLRPAKQKMIAEVNVALEEAGKKSMHKLKRNRYLRGVDWNRVEAYLPESDGQKPTHSATDLDVLSEIRRRVLLKEKDSYWKQFKDGLLHPSAVILLSQEVDRHLDLGGEAALSDRQDIEERWEISPFLARLQELPVFRKLSKNRFYERLAVSYSCAKGLVVASDEALRLLSNIVISQGDDMDEAHMQMIQQLEDEIHMNRIHGLTFMRNLRGRHPDVHSALVTQQAIRSVLNDEKKSVERLFHRGRLTENERNKLLATIETRLKQLSQARVVTPSKSSALLLQKVDWLRDMDLEVLEALSSITEHRTYNPGATLQSQASASQGFVHILLTGSANVLVNKEIVAHIGPGDIVGEVHLLTHAVRSADVVTDSPCTTLAIEEGKLLEVMKQHPQLEHYLWKLAGSRVAENTLLNTHPYEGWSKKKLLGFLDRGYIMASSGAEDLGVHNLTILFNGIAKSNSGEEIKAPALYTYQQGMTFTEGSKTYVVPLLSRS